MWSTRRSWVFCSILSTFLSQLSLEPTSLWWNRSRVLLEWCKENTHWSAQIGRVGSGIQSRNLSLWATQWFFKRFQFFPRNDSLLNCFIYFWCIFLNIIYFSTFIPLFFFILFHSFHGFILFAIFLSYIHTIFPSFL